MAKDREDRRSNFASLLDAAKPAEQPTENWRPDVFRFSAHASPSALFVQNNGENSVEKSQPTFLDGFATAPPEPDLTLCPTSLLPDDPNDIALEIGLIAGLNTVSLQALRRRFAMHNHPDLLPKKLRAHAEKRMKIANHLIDEAMKKSCS